MYSILFREVAVKIRGLHLLVLTCLTLGLVPLSAASASAAGGATFTVTVASAYLHAEPDAGAERTYSVFQGHTYAITGRNADSSWVSIDFATASAGTWIRAAMGTIVGSLDSVPVASGTVQSVPAFNPPSTPATTTTSGTGRGQPASTGASSVLGIPGKTLNLTISQASLFAVDSPNAGAMRVASIFKGQRYVAVQRDPNANWLQIRLYGVQLVWVPASAGTLDGNILDLPQPGENLPPAPPEPEFGPGPGGPLPAWIPTITPHMRDIYAAAAQHERDKRIFTVVGDCNSLSYYYLQLVAKSIIDLQGNDYLGNVIEEFKTSFYRESVAVAGGFNVGSVLDPVWSDPQRCQPDESPFACELRLSRASIVFIALGTGDQYDWQSFEANDRRLIEFALANGVLPVLVTKSDSLEFQLGGAPQDEINNTIRRLGQEYDVPVLDFSQATATLPNHGLVDEPGYDFHLSGAGMGIHVLSTLETLDSIWRSTE
jgi:hypothetical protein